MRPLDLMPGLVRLATVLGAALLLMLTFGPLTGQAHAVTAQTGSLSFSGDPGEYVSGGQAYTYDAGSAQLFDVSGANDHNGVDVTVVAADGTRSSLFMFAPKGQTLTSGTTYTGALRWPYATAQDPQLEFDTANRQCDSSTGSFTVSSVVFGPYGYVSALDASFEQYCNGSPLALRGEVHLTTPPAPPALEVGLTVDPAGTIDAHDKQPTVRGTVTCNKPAQVALNGTINQDQKPQPAVNWFEDVAVACTPGAPVPWAIALSDYPAAVGFRPGPASVTVTGTAPDQDYPVTAGTGEQTATVALSVS